MKRYSILAIAVALFAGIALSQAQGPTEMPAPAKEHEWLKQLVGEWEVESEMLMAPGAPPEKSTGTESVRAIGGFWTQSEIKFNTMQPPMTGMMTLGFDPESKKYIGTWVDSYTSHLWIYNGVLDATGKILTLEAEGPDMQNPGKKALYRDAIEIKSKDHKVLTSSVRDADGKWVSFMTMQYRRKK